MLLRTKNKNSFKLLIKIHLMLFLLSLFHFNSESWEKEANSQKYERYNNHSLPVGTIIFTLLFHRSVNSVLFHHFVPLLFQFLVFSQLLFLQLINFLPVFDIAIVRLKAGIVQSTIGSVSLYWMFGKSLGVVIIVENQFEIVESKHSDFELGLLFAIYLFHSLFVS